MRTLDTILTDMADTTADVISSLDRVITVYLDHEIAERRELMSSMVGALYPKILQDEIDVLLGLRGEINGNGRAARMSKENRGAVHVERIQVPEQAG